MRIGLFKLASGRSCPAAR